MAPFRHALVDNGLYLILSPRSVANSWHWGLYLHINEDRGGWKTHINNASGGWIIDSKFSENVATSQLIVTFLQIGTIHPAYHSSFIGVAPTLVPLRHGDPHFDCRIWLLETIQALANSRYITLYSLTNVHNEAVQLATEAFPNVSRGWAGATVAISRFSA